jgi:hypothetical protein
MNSAIAAHAEKFAIVLRVGGEAVLVGIGLIRQERRRKKASVRREADAAFCMRW